MDLSRTIHLYNDGKETFNGRWDGEDITIEPGAYSELQAGVAGHFIDKNPNTTFRIEELQHASTEPRTPVNPLEQTNRGEAFSAVKRRKKASGE